MKEKIRLFIQGFVSWLCLSLGLLLVGLALFSIPIAIEDQEYGLLIKMGVFYVFWMAISIQVWREIIKDKVRCPDCDELNMSWFLNPITFTFGGQEYCSVCKRYRKKKGI